MRLERAAAHDAPATADRAAPAALPADARPDPPTPALARVPAARPRRAGAASPAASRWARRSHGEFGLYDAAGPARSTSRPCSSPTPPRSWPAAARTRSCCRPSAMLGGISLLLMQRLPQDLVTQTLLRDRARARRGPARSGCSAALIVATTLGIVVRSDSWLRRYKYTWAAAGRRPAAPDVRPRHRDQRPAPDPPARAAQRPAVRAAQGHPRRLPGRLPVREPGAARRAGHAARAAPPAAAAVPRPDGRDVGDRARHRRHPARPRRRAAVLRRRSWRCSTSPPGGSASSSSGSSCSSLGSALMASCSTTSGPGSTSGSTRSPTRSAPATRSSRRSMPSPAAGCSGSGSGNGLPEIAGRPPIPEVHTDFPLAALGEELGIVGGRGDPRAVPRRRRARPADRRRRGGRLPVAARGRPGAGHRRPGVHHRGRQPQGPAADRRDPAVHQLRRLVAAGQRARHRAAAGPLGQGRRAAAAAARRGSRWRRLGRRGPPDARAVGAPAGRSVGRRSTSRSSCRSRSALLAGAAGYWGVVQAPELVRSPNDAGGHRRGPDGAARPDHRPRRQGPGRQQEGRERRVVPRLRRHGRSARSSATPRRATAGPASSGPTTPS